MNFFLEAAVSIVSALESSLPSISRDSPPPHFSFKWPTRHSFHCRYRMKANNLVLYETTFLHDSDCPNIIMFECLIWCTHTVLWVYRQRILWITRAANHFVNRHATKEGCRETHPWKSVPQESTWLSTYALGELVNGVPTPAIPWGWNSSPRHSQLQTLSAFQLMKHLLFESFCLCNRARERVLCPSNRRVSEKYKTEF